VKSQTRKTITAYLFLLPWIVALLVFIGYPFAAGFYFSFCEFPPLQGPLYIGLANYTQLLTDPVFHRSLGVTMTFAAVAIPLGVLLALTLALLLNTRIRGLPFYRVVFFLPHLVPTVVVAILWMWIFNPNFGLLNAIIGPVLRLADNWIGLFFELGGPGQADGHIGLRPTSALLLLPFVPTILACLSRLRPQTNHRSQGSTIIRVAVLAACVLSGLTIIYSAMYYLSPEDMLRLHSPGWLADGRQFPAAVPFAPSWALWGIIVMSMWGVGQMAVIYLAKLQDVPVQLYEAADIDGATWWQKTRHITIPMVSPVILFNVVMAIIGTFQIFAEPYIMTKGGPEDKTRFLAMFIYDQAFAYQRVGYASAVAWLLFLLIIGLTMLAFRLSRRHVYYAGR